MSILLDLRMILFQNMISFVALNVEVFPLETEKSKQFSTYLKRTFDEKTYSIGPLWKFGVKRIPLLYVS